MPDTAYATVAEYQAYPGSVLPNQIPQIQATLNAAARAIDRWLGLDTQDPNTEAFVAIAVATTKEYIGKGTATIRIDSCTSVTTVEQKSPFEADSDYTALVAADFITFRGPAEQPDFSGSPITGLMMDGRGDFAAWINGRLRQGGKRFAMSTVRVTALWGYAIDVPEQVKLATIGQALRWMTRFKAGMADTTVNPEFGVMMFRQSLDPDIKQMLERFMQPTVG